MGRQATPDRIDATGAGIDGPLSRDETGGCGRSRGKPRSPAWWAVVVCVAVAGPVGTRAGEPAPPPEQQERGALPGGAEDRRLAGRLERDGHRAVAVLREAVCGGAPLSTWSAVYLQRLGIPHDTSCARDAVASGLTSEDGLLRALCWRRAIGGGPTLPAWRDARSADPTVRALAAAAYAVRGTVPDDLRHAWAIPEGAGSGRDRKAAVEARANHLAALAAPFDDGPVALAAAFVEARLQGTVISANGKKKYAAQALRAAFFTAAGVDRAAVLAKLRPGPYDRHLGEVPALLDNRLAEQSPDTLRAIALTGPDPLRRAGLRAIAVAVRVPAAGDMAAAAAALGSADPSIRVEGARTFLLLLKRIRSASGDT